MKQGTLTLEEVNEINANVSQSFLGETILVFLKQDRKMNTSY